MSDSQNINFLNESIKLNEARIKIALLSKGVVVTSFNHELKLDGEHYSVKSSVASWEIDFNLDRFKSQHDQSELFIYDTNQT